MAPGAMTLKRAQLLLLALGLGLASAQKTLQEVPVQPGFDAYKVEGRWLTIQLATSHTDLVSPTDPLRLSLHSIWTRDNGDVDFMLFWKGERRCTGINGTVHPTGLQGQYQGTFEGVSMHVCLVSTDYSNLILYVRFEDDKVTNLWVLLARQMFKDPTWLGKYWEYVEKFHLQRAPVFNMDGQCPPGPA
ncbi:beta-lactoglobulin isoform X2 [Castor canadensis]|uniref:Beta-lactoglobulin isoform X2 n=1 Tax=Castor canadensis TaxID=51338 RepID=A0AC58KVG8_CASCN